MPTKEFILSDLAVLSHCGLHSNCSFSKYLQTKTKTIENVSSMRKVMLVTKKININKKACTLLAFSLYLAS